MIRAVAIVEPSFASAWKIEQRKREIARLESILRNPQATEDEKQIASDMLAYWKEAS